MTNLALVTAGRAQVVESLEQMTLVAAEAMEAMTPVRIDGTTGKFTKSNATDATEARTYGLTSRAVVAGMPVTAIKKGVMDGLNIAALAYDADVFLSNTDGTLADAAGTVSKVLGKVIPGNAVTLGTSPDKLMLIDI